MKSTLKVSDIGEKQLIERIIEKSKLCSLKNPFDLDDFNSNYPSSNFKTSIGDDSALLNQNLNTNHYLVASSDMLIQSSHFPREMTYYQMGYKSVIVNVSDLASMGAKNIGFLLNIAIPKDTSLDNFDDLICGIIRACDNYNIPLVGGDTNEASEIILSGTAIGQVEKGKALMKHGFKEGDLVSISDHLGYAALGFELLKIKEENIDKYNDIIFQINKIDPTVKDLALFKALKPEAKYEEGRILASHNSQENRISATDITDGLASEFYEILNADKKYYLFNKDTESHNPNDSNDSNDLNNQQNNQNNTNNQDVIDEYDDSNYSKGIRIYEDKLPVDDEFKQIADVLGIDYLDLFLHIGEDFELLFTINKELKSQLENDMNFYVIGEITNNNTVEIVLSNGDIKNISSKGYEHLK
ncbi:thiamine monphosphate kinase ThiL [Methanobrevibacter ruminantium M1]|uniref:Thiamine-monophosphate kinase n=1 Tax=Methanobrevibacter ruminantium (strain ATCC 35063 / DSM 1093 / JCM 13430 / OCM 146 / M1) TaxID=634498 RepID=D3E1F8_METRM|nr:thiamine-phosphate kinase [Methanobrevibacter ruminantium]ADC48043.1 thiamine monphosphate kinase ThiL [Methanobrevibacter ruminantium M1]